MQFRGTYLGVRFGQIRLGTDAVRLMDDGSELACPRGKMLPLNRAFEAILSAELAP